MISLIEILLENNPTSSPQGEEVADEIGSELDDIFRQQLKIAGKQIQSQSNSNVPQNEAILTITTLAIIASIPGFLKAVSKIGESISKKQGLDLTKNKGGEAWYSVLGKFVDKIESYIDTPFNLMLTPFIKDEVKRKKIIGIIKAASIITLAILGSIDFTKAPDALQVVRSSAGEFAGELLQKYGTKNIDNIVTTVKFIVKKVITQ